MEGDKSFNEWEQIQSPTNQSREWEMVAFEDNRNHRQADLSIFPPNNHEGLQIPQPPPESQTIPGQPCSSAVSNVKAEKIAGSASMPQGERNGIGKLLRSGGFWIASRVHYYVIYRGGFRSIASLSVLAAAVLIFSRFRRWRKWIQEERQNHLILRLKEKDQGTCHFCCCCCMPLVGSGDSKETQELDARAHYQPALAPNRTNERNAIIASQGCSHPSWLIDPSYMKADGSSGILHNY